MSQQAYAVTHIHTSILIEQKTLANGQFYFRSSGKGSKNFRKSLCPESRQVCRLDKPDRKAAKSFTSAARSIPGSSEDFRPEGCGRKWRRRQLRIEPVKERKVGTEAEQQLGRKDREDGGHRAANLRVAEFEERKSLSRPFEARSVRGRMRHDSVAQEVKACAGRLLGLTLEAGEQARSTAATAAATSATSESGCLHKSHLSPQKVDYFYRYVSCIFNFFVTAVSRKRACLFTKINLTRNFLPENKFGNKPLLTSFCSYTNTLGKASIVTNIPNMSFVRRGN